MDRNSKCNETVSFFTIFPAQCKGNSTRDNVKEVEEHAYYNATLALSELVVCLCSHGSVKNYNNFRAMHEGCIDSKFLHAI